ncbi:MAG: hypothetical protein JSR36_08970 [Proteobacteria bacterium]|nr:hypothetical protein [Pseudomonadota bacterium]
MSAAAAPRSCLRTVLLFGASGFLAGFIGPMVLTPDSNIGPLVGVLFTGPAGVLIGLAACLLSRAAPRLFSTGALRALAALLVLATLYACLPEPRLVGSVLDAEIADCRAPPLLYPAALQNWEAALARTPQARPLADWRQQAQRNVESFDALAVTLHVLRSRAVFERRRPWDRGERFARPWSEEPPGEHAYFVRAGGATCAQWQSRERALYWPVRDETDEPIGPAAVWPPVDAAGFLGLQELGEVPARIGALLR